MDNNKEKTIINWLTKQSKPFKYLLNISYIFNLLNIFISIIQSFLLSIHIDLFLHNKQQQQMFSFYTIFSLCFIIRSLISILINRCNYFYSKFIKLNIRNKILNNIIQTNNINNNIGCNTTIIIEQIESIQEYYNKYVPQLFISIIAPFIIIAIIFYINWISSIIIIIISIIIVLFINIIGHKVIDKNKQNFQILSYLSGLFLNRLKCIEIIRLFNFADIEIQKISKYIEKFRIKNMEILKIAFLTSAILEFFHSIAIAFIAMYFSFTYLHIINISLYKQNINIFHSFFILILVTEYFQYFNNLGILYHIKAKAVGAAELIIKLIDNNNVISHHKNILLFNQNNLLIYAKDLVVKDNIGNKIIGPLSFKIYIGQRIIITGPNGCGKSTLLNVILGFIPYEGILKINNINLKDLNINHWHHAISWVKQNPSLPAKTIKDNLFFHHNLNCIKINKIIKIIGIKDFADKLPNGLDTIINVQNTRLSIGQIQRIAIARALIKNSMLLLLDEPISNIDIISQTYIINALCNTSINTSIIITHNINKIKNANIIWFMNNKGKIIQTKII
ncbi:ATP-binding cassette domain-containing protein [Enterobacteriaceae endosymbiont of Neohaemonia nigricornis]|uniref:ATP-binding cassette domain-containing protein n=1 Tax=Enterobacteriaceae endosymbiont of Neohaemonia nigricornis TaxID=2675792 RepID=UPI0014498CB2|nr:ATP-binding cassette domain-containing protein [Enterobacteriaceae endosymbiont of Neohaemonia nigricornis]QJC30605.1 ATP-binding cassette domain-containing protein [Enterobacteriaceae endosymbiont of Neohaemonia nigricornis]